VTSCSGRYEPVPRMPTRVADAMFPLIGVAAARLRDRDRPVQPLDQQ
jgi:hypothetical protein